MAMDSALGMKKILRFAIGLLVNVCIVFLLVKVFAGGFNFAYDVFATSCKDPSDKSVEVIQILPDSSIKDVCELLDDVGVVKNPYALMVKIRIGSYASKIQPGTYEVSPSYTNDQLITVITGGKLE